MGQNIHDRKRPRAKNDRYETPHSLVSFILDRLEERLDHAPKRILDPGAGDGRFMAECHRRWPEAVVRGVDVDPRHAQVRRGDYLNGEDGGKAPYDLIVGNPPFKLVDAFLRRSLSLSTTDGTVALIARVGVIGGQSRISWLWERHRPEALAVLKKRPRFKWGKPDMADNVVVIARGQPAERTELLHWDNTEAFE